MNSVNDMLNLANKNIIKCHGAPNAIDGNFSVNHNKSKNDFGNGLLQFIKVNGK